MFYSSPFFLPGIWNTSRSSSRDIPLLISDAHSLMLNNKLLDFLYILANQVEFLLAINFPKQRFLWRHVIPNYLYQPNTQTWTLTSRIKKIIYPIIFNTWLPISETATPSLCYTKNFSPCPRTIRIFNQLLSSLKLSGWNFI